MKASRIINPSLGDMVQDVEKYHDYEFPLVSIIIPSLNNAQSISGTLENLLEQDYPRYEVVVVDGGSTDRTLEIIKSFHDDRIHIYTSTEFQRYEMLNRGITQAKGRYLTALFPGDFYISPKTLRIMMSLALDHEMPHMVYCGALLRDGKTDPKILYRPLNMQLLHKGHQPTSLQSMWWRADTFHEIGKYSLHYQLRGGFDLLCRFCLHGKMSIASTTRVLTDYDLRFITRGLILRHFWETFNVIKIYFGFWIAFKWLFYQKDIARYSKQWLRSVRFAFLGR